MHEDLLGYLLGALEPHEMRRVEEWLREDPSAREELARIERSLKPLDEGFEAVDPPPRDLISRTLDQLPPLPAAEGSASKLNADGPHESVVGHAGADESDAVPLIPMQQTTEAAKRPGFSWLDLASGCVAAAVLLGLLLPSLAQGRLEARKTACQDQLRQFGVALPTYANRSHQDRLPAVAAEGPEAFAGIYAIRLWDAGLLGEASIRWCPSLDLSLERSLEPTRMVSVDELHRASVDKLREIQRFVGGHYAYTLGVIDKQDHFTPPRFESRSSFAVMSDAPLHGMTDGKIRSEQIGHSGEGINVLFEDGRVQFLRLDALDSMRDHPLVNHHRRVEAGVNVDDASLAPSWSPPFIDVQQR